MDDVFKAVGENMESQDYVVADTLDDQEPQVKGGRIHL